MNHPTISAVTVIIVLQLNSTEALNERAARCRLVVLLLPMVKHRSAGMCIGPPPSKLYWADKLRSLSTKLCQTTHRKSPVVEAYSLKYYLKDLQRHEQIAIGLCQMTTDTSLRLDSRTRDTDPLLEELELLAAERDTS